LIEIVGGLGRKLSWAEIGENWRRQMPRMSSRLQGPWTPPYDQALGLLDKAAKAPRALAVAAPAAP
jgi:hypothetical protein